MASSANAAESVTQYKSSACRCGEGDSSLWTSRLADNGEKQASKCPNCQVYKSGYLLLSSKGIGWTSWKKRWFILTRTSLVFFRSDPDSPPQKGNEGNLTLGGIDLNNSASIVVKADKKLLTVLFPDGREGRAFTLKAETSEDLLEWKTALESALAQAPNPALAMGANGIFRNDTTEPEPIEPSLEQAEKDKQPMQSTVIGQPVQVALEDSDGNPSFLEKALMFIEQHGIKVEGILRQSADVEEVERRVREYEQGKVEFSEDEDAHVIGDCIKHVLREMPSSPVPAPCCTALVEAYRTERGNRIDAIRDAIYETFPDHNLRLLQRILKMMLIVASHKTQNRMSLSALAACMAPLLLRPLLAGDCEFDDNFSMGGDGSIQLLKAAAAANHAQAIVIILLEEYDKVFDEDLFQEDSSSEIYSESEDGDFEDYESTDNDFPEHDGYDDTHQDTEAEIDDDPDHASNGTVSESGSFVESDRYDKKIQKKQNKASSESKDKDVLEDAATVTETKVDNVSQDDDHKLMSPTAQVPPKVSSQKMEELQLESSNALASPSSESNESVGEFPIAASAMLKSVSHNPSSVAQLTEKVNEPTLTKRPTVWGRTSARKNLSMESIELSSEDESAIQKLENAKSDLETKIAKEVKGNAVLQDNLEKRKEALHERRLALEQDVERLKKQLQKERDLKASLESGLANMQPGRNSYTFATDSKIRADLEEVALAEADINTLNEKVADLRGQLNNEIQRSHAYLCQSCGRRLHDKDQPTKNDQLEVVERNCDLDQNDESSKVNQTEDENLENQIQNSAPSGGQIPQKPKANTTNEASTKSKGSMMAGRRTPSRKFSARHENVKKEGQDQLSLPNRQSSERKITTNNSIDNVSSSDNPRNAGTDSDPKKPYSRAEEGISSSSALLKLTSRLNFLKERRAQLVNDIKNSEINRTLGLEGPLPGTNPK